MIKPMIEQQWTPGDTLDSDFLAIPHHVYADSRWWPGEDSKALARQFSALNPWFRQGTAWCGYIPGEARLAGFATRLTTGETVVQFGYWETINALVPSQRLFAALARWARAQGATRLVGPIHFSTLGKFRLRLDTPSCPPFPGEPFNPPWYQQILAQLGFSQLAGYLSIFDDAATALRLELPTQTTGRWRSEDFTLQALTPALWEAHKHALWHVVTHAFSNNVGWTPCSEALFDWHFNAQTIQPFCNAPASCIAFGPQGDIAGLLFNLALPERQTGIFKTIMIASPYRRSPLYAMLIRHFLTGFGSGYTHLGSALLNRVGPTTQTALRACCSPNRTLHHYGLFHRDIVDELL
ncbi:hypothetical protein SAMN04487787_104106 [Kosakonia sacchari]|nr:hypothetical protein SAMN04487787_104106 [Kosakonia sacchari]